MTDYTHSDEPQQAPVNPGKSRLDSVPPWLGITAIVIAIALLLTVIPFLLKGIAVGLGFAVGVALAFGAYQWWSERNGGPASA